MRNKSVYIQKETFASCPVKCFIFVKLKTLGDVSEELQNSFLFSFLVLDSVLELNFYETAK